MENFIRAGDNYYNKNYIKEFFCDQNKCCIDKANTEMPSTYHLSSGLDSSICFFHTTKEYEDLVEFFKYGRNSCVKK